MLADLDLHFIELSKFDNQVTQDTLTQWCLFLKEPNMIIETNNIDESIKRAYEELAKMSQDQSARAEYEERLKQLRDLESIKDTAFEKGMEKGREEAFKTMVQAFYNNGFPLEQM